MWLSYGKEKVCFSVCLCRSLFDRMGERAEVCVKVYRFLNWDGVIISNRSFRDINWSDKFLYISFWRRRSNFWFWRGKMCIWVRRAVKNNDMLVSMTELFLTVIVYSNYSHKSDNLKRRWYDCVLPNHDSYDFNLIFRPEKCCFCQVFMSSLKGAFLNSWTRGGIFQNMKQDVILPS